MAFRIMGIDEDIPQRTKGAPRHPELDKIAKALRAGARVEIPLNTARGAKSQVTSLRSSLAYRGLAVSVCTGDKFIYVSFGHETPIKHVR
jgi:hypothetical protein